ncbi:MAG: hypothetical protein HFG20_05125 [Anaerotruncus sp.]|nr:hypothetical protein [Anaerotruncus sp.]
MRDPGLIKAAAFGGFDKKSVLAYIDSLNEEFHAAEQDYQEKLDSYEKAQDSQLAHIQTLEARLSEQNAKLEALAQQIEQERESMRQAQELVRKLNEQNRALEKQHDDDQRELQIQLERNRQLQFKMEALDHKSKKYDEVSNQIGEAMIEAHQNADRIIATANSQAQDMLGYAKVQLRGFYSELDSFKGDAARLRKSIEEILFVLNDRIDVMQEIVTQVEKRFSTDGIKLDFCRSEEKEPFTAPADEAGYLGGSEHDNLED